MSKCRLQSFINNLLTPLIRPGHESFWYHIKGWAQSINCLLTDLLGHIGSNKEDRKVGRGNKDKLSSIAYTLILRKTGFIELVV